MTSPVSFALSYSGELADQNEIDLYDVGQALIGFQRSLALTTHLVLNGEVITQAPKMKGARILALPAEEGSWKMVAVVVAGLYTVSTSPRDTPLGHLIASAYDYVVSETMGFHVDYDKSLGEQYEEMKDRAPTPKIPQSKFDAVAEKCELAVKEMHRPIIWSQTADQAIITATVGSRERPLSHALNLQSYEFLHTGDRDKQAQRFSGRVSSYNINTYRGQIYLPNERRPIPFELAPSARTDQAIGRLTVSLNRHAKDRSNELGNVTVLAHPVRRTSGALKSLYVVGVL